MDPIEVQWGIFFVLAVAGISTTMALPIDAWGIFFLSGLAVRSASGRMINTGWHENGNPAELARFHRVEVEFLRVDNGPCSGPMADCRPRLIATLDSEQKTPKQDADFATIDFNSPTGNKSVKRDFCGESSRVKNIRVRAVLQTMEPTDNNASFDCFFGPDTPDLANNAETAEWSKDYGCNELYRKDTRLWFRFRWYTVAAGSCGASDSAADHHDNLLKEFPSNN